MEIVTVMVVVGMGIIYGDSNSDGGSGDGDDIWR
jgi:hypothetical protein